MAIQSRMFLLSLATLLLAAAIPAAPLAAAAESKAAASPDSPAPAPQVKVRAEEDPADAYAIGIGDVIEIAVWKNPDLTVTVPVRPDGRVSVPLLGDVQAAGMTPLALKQTLTEGFRQYVTAPGVSVVIKEINSQKVFVTGEVAKPGAYDLRPHTKLMQALALAGGLTPYAKGRVILLRDRQGKDRRFEMGLADIIKGRRPEDNIVLQAGDTLIFP
jgi:polysaccharide export outer membrane protein